jgi:hypothetical protein
MLRVAIFDYERDIFELVWLSIPLELFGGLICQVVENVYWV